MNKESVEDIEKKIQEVKKEILIKEEQLAELLSQIEEQDNQES